jgi:hypothetical protein
MPHPRDRHWRWHFRHYDPTGPYLQTSVTKGKNWGPPASALDNSFTPHKAIHWIYTYCTQWPSNNVLSLTAKQAHYITSVVYPDQVIKYTWPHVDILTTLITFNNNYVNTNLKGSVTTYATINWHHSLHNVMQWSAFYIPHNSQACTTKGNQF